MSLGRQLAVACVVSSSVTVAATASASEVHFAGDDVRITVDDEGTAHIEHALSYRVSGAPPKAFELNGVEPDAVLDPVAPVALDGEALNAARVDRKGDRVLRIALDGAPRRITGHGSLVIRVGYTSALVPTGALTLDGAMWRLGWTAPFASEGYDSARVVFDLPAAPTEPRAVAADPSEGDDGHTATLRRGALRDELELERPHVARGEAAVWTVRVDPRAFPRVTDPALRPVVASTPAADRSAFARAWMVALLAGAGFAALVAAKWRRFDRACRNRHVVARGIVGWPASGVRAWLAGGAFAAGVMLQLGNRPGLGAGAVALAMLLAAARAPRAVSAPRGPGQWLALTPAEAFASERASDPLDAATWAGRASFIALFGAAVALGVALRGVAPDWTWLAPLDALVLVPIFLTGSKSQLPPDRARSPRRRLSRLHRTLRRDTALRVAPWARIPLGATAPDELRLLVLPRAAMPGVVGIEVGVAWVATPAGYAPETEVLVRVRDATAAAARLVALAPRRRAVPGRKTDERVVRLVPTLPSYAGAAALVRRLAEELRDRRKSLPGVQWPGAERRLPPNERLRCGAAAAAA
jgi:hypothetical protein